MTLCVRLDPAMRAQLERLARRKGLTKSDVIREALHTLALRDEDARTRPSSAYEAIRHLIGCVKGGPPDLSTRTGRGFRRLLEQRKRG